MTDRCDSHTTAGKFTGCDEKELKKNWKHASRDSNRLQHTPLVQLLSGIISPNEPSKLTDVSQTRVRCFQNTHDVFFFSPLQLAVKKRHVLLTFFTDLWVGTAVNAADSSPTFMFTSLFFVAVIAEYFSATFSLSLNSLLACFTSSFASPTQSVMAI